MNRLSMEILAKYQVRKTKEQKARFIAFMQEQLPELTVEEGGRFPRCKNLVLGDVDSAKYILSAHYDTCAKLPFPNFITPKNFFIFILYSLLVCIPFFAVLTLADVLLAKLSCPFWLTELISLLILFLLLFLVFIGGKPNPHTANDNTSGVITLCELIFSLSEEELRQTAFVFFDHEETGLFGSAFFRKTHKNVLKDKLLINFDCVSDGEHILLVQNKAALKKHGGVLQASFLSEEGKTVHLERSSNTLYPSDQMGFPCSVAVAALKKKPVIGLYLNRIHTPRDTVLDESNIRFLCKGIRRFYQNNSN